MPLESKKQETTTLEDLRSGQRFQLIDESGVVSIDTYYVLSRIGHVTACKCRDAAKTQLPIKDGPAQNFQLTQRVRKVSAAKEG